MESWEKGLTRKELAEKANVPFYTIDYLNRLGRLPLIKKSRDKGRPNLYHPDCIQIVKDHTTNE